MRLPLSPLEAFTQDLQSLPNDGPADVRAPEWLTIASAAHALGSLHRRNRAEFLDAFDASLLPPRGQRPTIVHDAAPPPSDGIGLVTEQFRVAAEAMERGGFLNLAYTTVSALCRLVVREDPPTRLMTTMHLGRIARQLSDLPAAMDCYRTVASEGLRKRDGPAAARGFLGLGLLSVMRGNLPLVREMFERALEHAHPGGNVHGLAHMGLANVARREGRYDEALHHGWCAHDLVVDPDERAGILGNISTIALHTGYPAAALKGFVHVMSLSSAPERLVGVLDDAMQAAAIVGDPHRLAAFEARGLALARGLRQAFEIARFTLAAATAWHRIGDVERGRTRVMETIAIAGSQGYHELEARAVAMLDTTMVPSYPGSDAARPGGAVRVRQQFVEGIERLEALGA